MGREKISFEKAVSELEEVVDRLEKGDLSLDESIGAFQRGIELSRYCSKRLDEIERKITVLVDDGSGGIKEKPFNEGRMTEVCSNSDDE